MEKSEMSSFMPMLSQTLAFRDSGRNQVGARIWNTTFRAIGQRSQSARLESGHPCPACRTVWQLPYAIVPAKAKKICPFAAAGAPADKVPYRVELKNGHSPSDSDGLFVHMHK